MSSNTAPSTEPGAVYECLKIDSTWKLAVVYQESQDSVTLKRPHAHPGKTYIEIESWRVMKPINETEYRFLTKE